MNITAQLLEKKEDSKADFTLSVSKAKTFIDCKAKYRYTYIEKLPRKEWEHHVFGKYLHAILENFENSLIAQELLQPGQNHSFNDHMILAKTFALKEYESKLTKTQHVEADAIIDDYLEILSSQKERAKILAVEKSFNIDINGDILLNGFIDLVQLDTDNILHVADYKTTKDKKYMKDYFQLLTYAYVLMLEDPKLEVIRASYIMLRHNFEFLTKEFTRDDVMCVGEKFVEYAEQIHDEKLWRANPQFLCKYCDHMDVCSPGKSYLVKRGVIKDNNTFGLSEW